MDAIEQFTKLDESNNNCKKQSPLVEVIFLQGRTT